jgi:Ca2+-binding RTX toxin-like protein
MRRLSELADSAGSTCRGARPIRSGRISRRNSTLEKLEQRLVLSAFTPQLGDFGVESHNLREAVQQANSNGEDDIIYLSAGLWQQNVVNGPGGQENQAATGDYDLTEANQTIIIEGQGPGVTIVDGKQLDRLFHVHPDVTAVFRNLTITNAQAYDNGFVGTLPNERPAMGGAILVESGTLHLENVELSLNTARGAEGIVNRDGRDARGGALAAVQSTVVVGNSTFFDNRANGGAGGYGPDGPDGVNGGDGESGDDGGTGGFASGAAIYADESTLTISDSLFDQNAANGGRGGNGGDGGSGEGGGFGGTGAGGGQGGNARGGAVFLDSGTLEVSSSVFQSGSVRGGSAGHGGRGGRGGQQGGSGSPNGALGGGSNIGGRAQGGAIWVGVGDITISQTRMIDAFIGGGIGGRGGVGGNGGHAATNTGGSGGAGGSGGEGGTAEGGGYYQAQGTLTLLESEIADNTIEGGLGGEGGSAGSAGDSGPGGIPAVKGGNGASGGQGGDGHGGGIFVRNVSASITNVTISGNEASGGEGGPGGGEGDGSGGGASGREGTSANAGITEGGGLWNDDAAVVTLRSSTVSNNNAMAGLGSGIYSDGSEEFVLDNSIVAGNELNADFDGRLHDTSSNNVIGNAMLVEGLSDGQNGNQFGSLANVLLAGLGPLQDNGGPTRTHALLEGSPAVNAGLRAVIPITDQRGVRRPLQSPVDIGAFEDQQEAGIMLPEGDGQYTLVADAADIVLKDQLNAEIFRYEFAALLDLTILPSADADELTIDFSQGPVLPADGVAFVGVVGAGDSLNLIGTSAGSITTYLNGAGTGVVSIDGRSARFENVLDVTDGLVAQQRTMQFGVANDQAMIENGLEAGYLTVTSGASGVAAVTSTVPTSALAINGGAGNDVIMIGDISSVIASRMIVDGQAGDDDLSAAPTRFAVSMTGGDGGDTIWGGRGNDTLDGAGGDDWIFARAGNDIVTGGDGVDRMSGNNGNDTLSGGDDRDSLYGGSGRDRLSGDDGNDVVLGQGGSRDTVSGGAGDDVIDGGAGIDTLEETGDVDFRITKSRLLGLGNDKLRFVERAVLTGGDSDNFFDGSEFVGRYAIFDGGAGNDSLLGSSGNDLLYGNGGDDTLVGGDGNDSLYGVDGQDSLTGGGGNDLVRGGDGDDTLTGDAGLDQLLGEAGNDLLDAGSEADLAEGGDGNDTITGGEGNDTLRGGTGDDQVMADAGDDEASGDAGDDSLDGGTGNDSLFGNDGRDRLFGHDDADELDGGTGDDDLHGQAGNDTARGGSGNDWLFGDEGADSLDGESGNDGVAGDGGNDIVHGGEGDDTLLGGTGSDRLSAISGANILIGGDGDDTLSGAGTGSETLSAGDGDDVLENVDATDVEDESVEITATFSANSGRLTVLAKADATVIVRDRFSMVEVSVDGVVVPGLSTIPVSAVQSILVRGTQGADIVELDFVSTEMFTGMREDGVLILGRSGNDSIIGSEFQDSILGGDGDDTIRAGKHDDTVRGEAGDDSVYGENGEDLLTGDDGNDWLDGGNDADILNGGAGHDTLRGRSGRDSLYGGGGNDALAGHSGDDILTGQSGNDTILGGDGDDTMYGGSGNDTMLGEFGSDLVNGQGGVDRIAGSHGDGEAQSGDRLIGPASEIDENFSFTADWVEDI